MNRFQVRCAALLLGAAAAIACAGPEPSVVADLSEAEDSAAPVLAGMPEGINDPFLSAEMDVDRFVERFEGESRDVYAKRLEIAEALDLKAGDRVADIGAGTGFFSFLFAREVGPTGKVHAVEISPGFLELLRERANLLGNGAVEVVEGTEKSVGLPEASTDLAFICDVYHHFAYPQDSLASLYAAIRPGGSLVLIEFSLIPGVTSDFIMEHVRAGREVFTAEIEAAGFVLADEIEIEGLDDNYILRFTRPE